MDDRSPVLTARFERALAYAARLHAAQRRKGTRIPLVDELERVVSELDG